MSLDVSKPEPAQVRVDIGCTGSTATLNMSSTRAGLLHRILSLWISPWHMRRGMAAAVWAARPLPVDAKRARLPEVPAIFIPPAAFLSLPDSLLEEILQFLPTKDRYARGFAKSTFPFTTNITLPCMQTVSCSFNLHSHRCFFKTPESSVERVGP